MPKRTLTQKTVARLKRMDREAVFIPKDLLDLALATREASRTVDWLRPILHQVANTGPVLVHVNLAHALAEHAGRKRRTESSLTTRQRDSAVIRDASKLDCGLH